MPDVHIVTNLDEVGSYFNVLRGDLDGSGRGIGLQATSIKNELSALKQFAEWAAIDSHQDKELHSQLHFLINFVKDQIKVNQKAIQAAMTQKFVQKGDQGVTKHPKDFHKSITNDLICQKLDEIRCNYSIDKHNRCRDPHLYNFFMSYLINMIALSKFQRPSAVAGMTVEEVKQGLKKEVTINSEMEDEFEVLIADHKTGSSQPAAMYLKQDEMDLLIIFIKCFWPKNCLRSKVFVSRTSKQPCKGRITAIMRQFQKKYGLQPLTSTESRAAIENVVALDSSMGSDIGAITSHSRSVADKYYRVQSFHAKARQQYGQVCRAIHSLPAQEEPAPPQTLPQSQSNSAEVSPSNSSLSNSPASETSSCHPSSISSSSSGLSETDCTKLLQEKLLVKFPPSADEKVPIKAEVVAIIDSMDVVGTAVWRETVPRRVISTWRERQHKARAQRLHTLHNLKGMNRSEVEGLIKKHFPSWSSISKISGYANKYM